MFGLCRSVCTLTVRQVRRCCSTDNPMFTSAVIEVFQSDSSRATHWQVSNAVACTHFSGCGRKKNRKPELSMKAEFRNNPLGAKNYSAVSTDSRNGPYAMIFDNPDYWGSFLDTVTHPHTHIHTHTHTLICTYRLRIAHRPVLAPVFVLITGDQE